MLLTNFVIAIHKFNFNNCEHVICLISFLYFYLLGLDKKFKTAARDVFVILAEKLSTEWMYYGKLLCINDQCLYILNNQPNSLKDKMLSVLNEWKGNNPDKGWSHLRKLLLLRNEGELVKTCEMSKDEEKNFRLFKSF